MDESWETSGIYMLVCKANGKRYIGQSKNIKRRLNEHKNCKSFAPLICKAIAKYGWDAFDKTVLEFCPVEELDEKEIYYIAELKPEYNLTEGGDSPKGYKHSPETKELLKQLAKKQWEVEDYQKLFKKPIICIDTGEIFDSVKSAAASVGVTHSCISMALTGSIKMAGGYRWAYLNPEDKFSEERRKNLWRANRGKKQSVEDVEKRAAPLRGKTRKNFNTFSKPVFCVETGRIFASVKIAAESVGITPCFLSKVLHGKKKTAGGYHWKFAKEVFYMTENEVYDLLVETGAIMTGHFLLSSSLHSPHYVEKFNVLQHPAYTARLCRAIAQHFKDAQIETVVGPVTGGIILAHETGKALGTRAIFTERVDGVMTFRRGFSLHEGERVLIVEDVVTTGGSVREVIDVVKQFGGVPVAVSMLVDRSGGKVNFDDVPSFALLHMNVETYKPEDCPLCKENIPLTKRGSTGKK